MEDQDQIILLNVNSQKARIGIIPSVEPKVLPNEQEENDQIIRFEEDLAACFLDRMAIIL